MNASSPAENRREQQDAPYSQSPIILQEGGDDKRQPSEGG
jgi:hypothetical protein